MKLLDDLLRHFRLGLRLFVKDLSFTTLAALELALGIGFVVTVFSYVNGVMIRGLPFEDSGRIIHIQRESVKTRNFSTELPPRDFFDLRRQQTSFEEVAAFTRDNFKIRVGAEETINCMGALVTGNAFRLLRVQPMFGRTFSEAEDAPGAEPVALFGYNFWKTRLGGESNIVGKVLYINRRATTVIGVMPPDFRFPIRDDIWIPLRLDENSEGVRVEAFARLKKDVSISKAQAECSVIAKRIEKSRPVENSGISQMRVQPFIRKFMGGVDGLLWMMLGCAVCVLILACSNVTNLLLARASGRTKEMAIRAALGASRRGWIAQLLSESMLLAGFSAIGGMAIGLLGLKLLQVYTKQIMVPFWMTFELDVHLLLFLIGITIVVGLASGLFPAFQASRVDVNEVLKEDSRTAFGSAFGWFRRALVITQLGLSMALSIGAALLALSISRVQAVSIPFASGSVTAARIKLEASDNSSPILFFNKLREKLSSVPSVTSVALTTRFLLQPPVRVRLEVEGESYLKEEDRPLAHREVVSDKCFRTLGVPLIEGREFNTQDISNSVPVAIVNAALARRLWPGESPLGKRLRLASGSGSWIQVVGVVRNLRMEGVTTGGTGSDGGGMYLPMAQHPRTDVTVLMRSELEPVFIARQIRKVIAEIDPDQALGRVATLRTALDEELLPYQVTSVVFRIFGISAVFLAGMGIYGMMTFSVNRRIREFGIRLALGAQRWHILQIVMRQSGVAIVTGMACGLFLSHCLGRILVSVFPVVRQPTLGLYLGIVAVLMGIAVLAIWMPARRASRISPISALRHH